MERNALLAIALCFIILITYQEVTRRLYPPPPEGPIATAPEASPQQPQAAPAAPKPAEAIAEAAPAAPIEGREIVLENELMRAVFTTAGGRLKVAQLKKFRQDVGPESPPLDLVHDVTPQDRPLGLVLRQGGTEVGDAGVLYEADRDSVSVSGTDSGQITLRGTLGGMQIVKRVSLTGDRYLLGVDVEIAPGSAPSPDQIGISWQDHIGHPARIGNSVMTTSVLAIQDSHLHRFSTQCWFVDRMRGQCHALDDSAGTNLSEEHVRWAAFDGLYFLLAIVPKTDTPDTATLDLRYKAEMARAVVLWPKGALKADFDVYLGPKKIEILSNAPQSLRAALDLGIFTVIALPLLHVLRFSHRLTGNYGIDIILLTVVIKALFMPLTKKSMQSMREMQKLQPQMAKIRERLKDKPDELNKEIIELYRRHKVNPLGGCLPMVLQIPVFIGLYQALLNAVELRHAPFFSWITDLSAPDRLGTLHLPFVDPPGLPVLTLLMGVSMFIQQLMTPSGADPAQQRMMLIMPVVFTFMFISFPSGLALYWLINNILTIAQQYTINRPET